MEQATHDIDVNFTLPQWDFIHSKKKFNLFLGGVGSGKTWGGAYKTIKKVTSEPGVLGFIGANTYKQLNRATLPPLFALLDSFYIPYRYVENRGVLQFCDTEIICASMDNYDVHRGIEIGWFWLDEGSMSKVQAFEMLMGRLRSPKSDRLEGWITTTPFGFNWLYDYFAGEKQTKEFKMFHSTSMDNPYLPDGYVDSLKDNYDSKVYSQEVLGEFTNISVGRIYYSFDRALHISPCHYDRNFPLYIGMDFNINPMTCTVIQTHGGKTRVIDEFYLMTSNTHEMADEIAKRYGRGHTVIPDSTGKALKTASAGLSDHDILRQKGFPIQSSGNPFRVDRYNCVNNLFEKSQIVIDPRCKKLIKDLEQVSYKEGSSLPDTTDKTLGHISDSLGYALWWKFPLFERGGDMAMLPR